MNLHLGAYFLFVDMETKTHKDTNDRAFSLHGSGGAGCGSEVKAFCCAPPTGRKVLPKTPVSLPAQACSSLDWLLVDGSRIVLIVLTIPSWLSTTVSAEGR